MADNLITASELSVSSNIPDITDRVPDTEQRMWAQRVTWLLLHSAHPTGERGPTRREAMTFPLETHRS